MIRLFSGTSRNSRRRSKSVDRLDHEKRSRRKTLDGNSIDPLEKLRNVKEEVYKFHWNQNKSILIKILYSFSTNNISFLWIDFRQRENGKKRKRISIVERWCTIPN